MADQPRQLTIWGDLALWRAENYPVFWVFRSPLCAISAALVISAAYSWPKIDSQKRIAVSACSWRKARMRASPVRSDSTSASVANST